MLFRSRIDCLKAVADEVIFMHAGVALVREPIETFFDPDEPKLKEFLGV